MNSPPPVDNLGAPDALELRCARLSAQAERVECAVAEICRANDVPAWVKRLLLDALTDPSRTARALEGDRANGSVSAGGRFLLDKTGAGS
jgi:hypothetical protein